MVARITDNSVAQEARPLTCSLDLVEKIRQRRLRWLGHLLRADENTITLHALQAQYEMYNRAVNLFLDFLKFIDLDQLSDLSQDRGTWSARVSRLI